MFNSTSRSSVAEEAAGYILELIRNGTYGPGEKLPGERRLAKRLDVGRTSVREAIRHLEAMGLLEVRQGLGTFVREPDEQILRHSLAPSILSDPRKLNELFETRKIIEIAAAGLAAERATERQIAGMEQLVRAIESHIARRDLEGIVTADVEFHRQIIIASGNNTLVALVDSLVDLLRDMRYDVTNIPALLPEIRSGHRAIFAAIEQHNPQAAREAMQEHLANVAQRVQSFWSES